MERDDDGATKRVKKRSDRKKKRGIRQRWKDQGAQQTMLVMVVAMVVTGVDNGDDERKQRGKKRTVEVN